MWGGLPAGHAFGDGEYEITGGPIGKGSGGTVYQAKAVASGAAVAVKVIDRLDVEGSPAKVKQLEREMNIAVKLRHQNIVNWIDVKFEEEVVMLILELVDGGPLFDRVAAGAIPEDEARHYFVQAVAGLEYCHEQQVIHRDLKLENVLVTRAGQVKIADFGMSKDLAVSSLPKTQVGTISYMAPEITMVGKAGSGVVDYGAQADVWSLAVILYILACGSYPFGFDGPRRQGGLPTSRVYQKIRAGEVTYPEHLSPEISELLQGMLTLDPQQRWGFAQIKQCAWFCGGKFVAAAGPEPEPEPAPVDMPLGSGVAPPGGGVRARTGSDPVPILESYGRACRHTPSKSSCSL